MTGLAGRPTGFERLNGPADAPVAIALSGGGDSTALLHMAAAWAREGRRQLVALTVDHGLNPASGAWTEKAAAASRRLAVAHRTLRWEGPKPGAGLPAAARDARHALLAEAARAAGARVILMAHTADDIAEAELMRAGGATTPSPRAWSPSPAWPEGRGVFILRPLLGRRRAALRAWLQRLGETWIDDPANDDPRSVRALARRRLEGSGAALGAEQDDELVPAMALDRLGAGEAGDLVVDRNAFRDLAEADARRLAAVLAVCAGGGRRPPRGARIRRLCERLRRRDTFTATLAGARITACESAVALTREAGDLLRLGAALAELPSGDSVFDGRYEIRAMQPGYRLVRLAGLGPRLPVCERAHLSRLPAAVRGALPAAVSPDGDVTCPLFTAGGPIFARPLTYRRAIAALGAFRDEATLCAWRKTDGAPKLDRTSSRGVE